MTDLVKRLRRQERNGCLPYYVVNPDGNEAADRIEELEEAGKLLCFELEDLIACIECQQPSWDGVRQEFENLQPALKGDKSDDH